MQRYLRLLPVAGVASLVGLGLGLVAVLQSPVDAQQSPSELLIRNGTIVNATGRTEGDVRIRNGTIAEIGRGLKPGPGAREVNASGKLVLPGGIDPHVHLGKREGVQGSDDYTSASRAALAGGITTIANFISHPDGELLSVTLKNAEDEVKAQAIATSFSI